MKVVALDAQKDGSWLKQWGTLDCAINTILCEKGYSIGYTEEDKVLLLIHNDYCSKYINNVDGLVGDSGFVMYVSGGTGCNNGDDPGKPHIHYSKRPIGTGCTLEPLAGDFGLLCRNLDAADNEAKIKSAWDEWEAPILLDMLAQLAPLAIMQDKLLPSLADIVARNMLALFRGKTGVSDRLKCSGADCIASLLDSNNLSGDSLLSFLNKNQGFLVQMSRRYL